MKILLNIDRNQTEDFLEEVLVAELQSVVRESIYQEGLDGYYEVSLSFVDEEEIKNLNHQYRKINKVTDVLSFPMTAPQELRGTSLKKDSPPQLLGDIVICIHQAKKQAKEYGHSLRRELCFLVCHSTLHLLGYDHVLEEDAQHMQEKERFILENLEIAR